MKWSEAITLEFVKMYLKHECLWNPLDPAYKLKQVREKAYTDIITEFRDTTSKSLSMPEVKNKIKNLRTTYLQQIHKILKKSSPDFIYQPSLVWFHEMDQCLKNLPASHTNPYKEAQESREVDSSNQVWVDADTNIEESNPAPLVTQSEEETEEQTKFEPEVIRVKKETRQSFVSPYKNKKKKFKQKRYTTESHNSSINDNCKEDEFDIYGKYIASQLRKMDLPKALKLQIEIQSLVSEARISDLSSD